MNQSPFNINPELAAMKEDIADRTLKIKLIGSAISAALFAGALLLPGLGTFGLLAMMAGGGLASLLTLKATKRLEIDQEYLESRMQGKNWWGGYREEVMEPGYEMGNPALAAMPSKHNYRGK